MNLSIEQIAEELGAGTRWQIHDAKLSGSFIFKDFSEALSFVNKVSSAARAANHHPNIFIEYNRVTLTLWTHSENGITEKDIALAKEIDKYA